jgi:membrane-bound serine protease (ClpP class)
MQTLKSRIVATAVALSAFISSAIAQDSLAGKTVQLPLDEFSLVSKPRIDWFHSQLDQAKTDGAVAIILDINCSGGLAWETRTLIKKLTTLGIPTVAHLTGDAAGPAALIALACDTIEFSAGATLGGKITDIEWRGPTTNLPDKLVDKTWDDVITDILTEFQPKALDENIIRGFIDQTPEISIGGEIVDGRSDYTRLTLVEAAQVIPFAKEATAREATTLSFTQNDLTAETETTIEDSDPTEKPDPSDLPQTPREPKFGETKLESYKDKIVILEVGDDTLIRSTKFEFMQRVLEKANTDGAEAVILDINSPGGLAFDTIDIMMDGLAKVDIPIIAFVNPKAGSAAALIAVATDTIYMNRPGTIGAAGVILGTGQDLPKTLSEKVTRTIMAAARGTANGKGHSADVAMAFIDPEIEVIRNLPTVTDEGSLNLFSQQVINPKGEMLVLDADQAIQYFDGKPILAKGIATNIDDVIAKEGLKGDKIDAIPLGFESVADWIVKLSPLLMMLGIAGVYTEMKTPGFGIPGAIAIVSFSLFFFGHSLAGKLAGFELFGVLILGLVFIALEIFVFPGVIVFGLLGTLMLVGSLIFAMVDKYDFQFDRGGTGSGSGSGNEGFTFSKLLDALETPLFNMTLAAAGTVILVILVVRYLPESRAMKWLILDTPQSTGAAIASSDLGTSLVSIQGESTTDLRPSGKGKFTDHGILDIITAGEFIPKGTPITITQHNGSNIVVEKLVS